METPRSGSKTRRRSYRLGAIVVVAGLIAITSCSADPDPATSSPPPTPSSSISSTSIGGTPTSGETADPDFRDFVVFPIGGDLIDPEQCPSGSVRLVDTPRCLLAGSAGIGRQGVVATALESGGTDQWAVVITLAPAAVGTYNAIASACIDVHPPCSGGAIAAAWDDVAITGGRVLSRSVDQIVLGGFTSHDAAREVVDLLSR